VNYIGRAIKLRVLAKGLQLTLIGGGVTLFDDRNTLYIDIQGNTLNRLEKKV
jgi:hypothetical protein